MKIKEVFDYLKSLSLQSELESRIKAFHALCSQPVTGSPAEGLLHNALGGVGVKTSWTPMSHAQEKDMVFEIGENKVNVSQKGCKESRTRISFSSYRTTSAELLEQKLDLIEKLDANLHMMFVFARMHTGKNPLPDYYKIYLINPHYLNPKKFKWKEERDADGVIKGFHTYTNDLNINMGIVQKMSGQLWVDIAKSNLEKHPDMILELMEIKI
jgi:hypothetical protein